MSAEVRMSLPRPRRGAGALLTDDSGATAVEYGLIAALMAMAILGGLRTLGADVAALPMQAIIDAITRLVP